MTESNQPDAEPLGLASTAELGPLPRPHHSYGPHAGADWCGDYYTTENMRAYARQERAAERERCAQLCRDMMPMDGVIRRTLADLERAILGA